jgi:hypothetical protein
MDRVIDGVEEVSYLVDAEMRISVEEKGEDYLAGCERPPFEGSVTRVGEESPLQFF